MESNIKVDIEEIVRMQMAQKIIDSVPEEERKKILEASLTKSLENALKPWAIKEVIESDVKRYMVEYLKRADVQDRIKISTRTAVDKLMDGVINVIVAESQKEFARGYREFMKTEESDK